MPFFKGKNMKKSNVPLIFLLISIFLVSCSQGIKSENSTFYFSINSRGASDTENLTVTLSITGDEERTVSSPIVKDQDTVLKVEDLNVGSVVDIEVRVTDEKNFLLYKGEYKGFVVEEGENTVSIVLDSCNGSAGFVIESYPDFVIKAEDLSSKILKLQVSPKDENAPVFDDTKYKWTLNGKTLETEEDNISISLVKDLNVTSKVNTVICEITIDEEIKSVKYQFIFYTEGDSEENKKIIITEIN